MKSVLILNGSPRKNGNTATLCDLLSDTIRDQGGKPEIIRISTLNILPCRACDTCVRNKDGMCVQKDDMHPLYGKILDANAIIFASPIYWFNYSAQLKLVIDRMYALYGMKGNPLNAKIMAGILVYGGSSEHNSGAINAINSLKTMFSYLGGLINEIIHGSAMNIGDVTKNEEILKKVEDLGIKIMKKII